MNCHILQFAITQKSHSLHHVARAVAHVAQAVGTWSLRGGAGPVPGCMLYFQFGRGTMKYISVTMELPRDACSRGNLFPK